MGNVYSGVARLIQKKWQYNMQDGFFGMEDFEGKLKCPSESVFVGDYILAKLSSDVIEAIQSGEVSEIYPEPTDSDYFVVKIASVPSRQYAEEI